MKAIKNFLLKYKGYFIIFIIVVLLEVALFNCKSFALIGGGYGELNMPSVIAQISNGEIVNGVVRSTSERNYITLEFQGFDRPVKNLYLDVEFNDKVLEKDVEVRFKDSTYSEDYRYSWTSADATVINGSDRSNYITLNTSGNVSALRIKIYVDEGEQVIVNSVTVNKPVPFNFSVVRFLAICLFMWGAYALWTSNSLKKSYKEKETLCINVFSVVTAVVVLLMYFFTYVGNTASNYSMLETLGGFRNGNQISQEIVDAFEAGQVSLLKEPSETMMSLKNPYDYSQRMDAGVNYEAWDHCLYEGKYYSYYGIGPVLTLFLPFHMLTGYYFSTNWAVLIYGIIGVIFLTGLYNAVVRRFFAKVQSNMVIMGHFMIMVSSGIFFSIIRPMFYEIAISSAFAAVAAGAYFLITSNVIGEGKLHYGKLAAATACLGFAVLCRPTTAVYCVASLAFIWFGFRKQQQEDKFNKGRKGWLIYLASAIVPYIVFGGIQMWYNYARFDSPFDFGINYSLTINDFTQSEFHIHFAVLSFFGFLFAIPQIIPNFPYVTGDFNKLNLTGFYFVDDSTHTGLTIGALFRALPIFSYLFGYKALKKLEKGRRLAPTVLVVLTCIVAPAAIVFSSWESGYAIRYFADFSWQLLIGALAIAFFLFAKCENEGVKRIVEGVFIVMTVLCLIVNAGQIYNFLVAAADLSSFVSNEWECKIYAFARLFDFWR